MSVHIHIHGRPRARDEWTPEARKAAAEARKQHKHPSELSDPDLQKHRKAWEGHSSALNSQMIAEGRGYEKPSETKTKTDPLSTAKTFAGERAESLHREHAYRAKMNFKNYYKKYGP